LLVHAYATRVPTDLAGQGMHVKTSTWNAKSVSRCDRLVAGGRREVYFFYALVALLIHLPTEKQ
jgi:hypothetical protein